MKTKKKPAEPMRLFIAIALSQPMVDEAMEVSETWFPYCPRANFTRPENLHITLRFLGMCDPGKVEKITSAMAWTAALAEPLSLRIGRPGYFKKGNESILWLGLSGDMARLQQLRSESGLSQYQLVGKMQLLGSTMSRGTYSKIELGMANIKVSDLAILQQIYDVDYSRFFENIIIPNNLD